MRYIVLNDNNEVENFIEISEDSVIDNPKWIKHDENIECNMNWKYVNGKFISPLRNIEEEWKEIREKRNKLLAESDIAVLPDRWAVMSSEKQNAWLEYRQALRDITKDYVDPKDVLWDEIHAAQMHGSDWDLKRLSEIVAEKFPSVLKLKKPE